MWLTLAFAFEPETAFWHERQRMHRAGFFEQGGILYAHLESFDSYQLDPRGGQSATGWTLSSDLPADCARHWWIENAPDQGRLGCARGDTIERESGVLIVQDSMHFTDVDIDGDGVNDLMGRDMTHLYTPSGYLTFPYPEPVLDSRLSFRVPIADVTGDGKADLIHAHATDEVSFGYFYGFDSGLIALHPGGASGFGEAAWTLELEAPLYEAITLQLDDDPQLEILGLLGSSISTISWDAGLVQIVRIDISETGEPSVVTYPPIEGGDTLCGSGCPAQLEAIGDIDGDGHEEVLLALSTAVDGVWAGVLRILTPSNGFDVQAPLANLQLTPEQLGDPPGYDDLQVLTSDLNGDGRLDVAMARRNDPFAFGQEPEFESTVQVWYAPWLAPDAEPEDTGAASPTGATGSTGDTAASPGPRSPGPGGEEPSGCGCSSTAAPAAWGGLGLWLLGVPWLRLRRGGSSCS